MRSCMCEEKEHATKRMAVGVLEVPMQLRGWLEVDEAQRPRAEEAILFRHRAKSIVILFVSLAKDLPRLLKGGIK